MPDLTDTPTLAYPPREPGPPKTLSGLTGDAENENEAAAGGSALDLEDEDGTDAGSGYGDSPSVLDDDFPDAGDLSDMGLSDSGLSDVGFSGRNAEEPSTATTGNAFAVRPAAAHGRGAPAGRTALGGVTWEMFRALRDEPANAGLRFTFDGSSGRLEIEPRVDVVRERVSRLVCLLVAAFGEETETSILPAGSLALHSRDAACGTECDEAFYVSTQDRAGSHGPGAAPPPDLAVELGGADALGSKLPVFAALGVAEVWALEEDGFAVHRRRDSGDYESVPGSVELPDFPLLLAADLIERRHELPTFGLTRLFREGVRASD